MTRGYGSLASDMRAVLTRVKDRAHPAVKSGAEYYAGLVKLVAPVDTGAYRDSICTDWIDKDKVGCGSPLDYMMRLEFGFVGTDSLGRVYNQPAKPHWRPVFDAEKGRIAARIAHAVRARGD